jgi:hypothetical protein
VCFVSGGVDGGEVVGYVPPRPPPPRGLVADQRLASLPWNRGLNPLLHTPTPGTLWFQQQAIDSMRWPSGTPAYVYGVPVSASATADAVGCRYCGRRKSGTATCAGCGAPS